MARILVVDDEHNVRLMMRLALQYERHTVETASDGEEALRAFDAAQTFDLVLLDQRMPGMTGLDVLRDLHARNPSLPVVMVTAFGTIDLAVEAMKSGATDFLRKPFTAETLRGAVAAALHQARPAHEAPGVTFGSTTINGFQIQYITGSGIREGGAYRLLFTLRSPSGSASSCEVVLPAYVMELAKAHLDRDQVPGHERFWEALCEEALANYVWQNAEAPPGGKLEVQELTAGLRRYIDTVTAA